MFGKLGKFLKPEIYSRNLSRQNRVKRKFLRCISYTGLMLAALFLSGCGSQPNVVIIVIDALRYDHMSAYSYHRDTTPNITAFSKDAVLFNQAISQSTFTKTSIASLFTSRYPYHHGTYRGSLKKSNTSIVSDILDEEEVTLSKVLLENGFRTVAWISNPHLTPEMGFDQGFQEFEQPGGWIKVINKKFIDWLEQRENKQEFFTYIHYLDLHDPYRPPPPYDKMYGVYSNFFSEVDFKNWGKQLEEINSKKRVLDGKDIDQLKAHYDGLINYIDHEVGLLLQKLRDTGVYDESLIIITSDHGDGFMEHGFISHSTIPYDELLRVPLIIKFPQSLYSGIEIDAQVRLIDVMPTILDFLKIKLDTPLDGESLLGYLDNKPRGSQKDGFSNYALSEVDTQPPYYMISVRGEQYKYIYFPNQGREEFYDLRTDPKEQKNIIGTKKSEAEDFSRIAKQIVAGRKKTEGKEMAIDRDSIDRLKSLGYMQ